jgi:hypothetical protein
MALSSEDEPSFKVLHPEKRSAPAKRIMPTINRGLDTAILCIGVLPEYLL